MIAWFARNRVAANLLMWFLILGGALTLPSIRQEEFPSIDIRIVQISVAYPGATPDEVESGVCLRIEEAIEGTAGIDRITTVAVEGACAITVELENSTDQNWALGELESQVNGITTFPKEAEKPVTSLVVMRQGVLNVAIAGDTDERTLKSLGYMARDELAALPGISQVDVAYVRPYEISIEVPEAALRRHGLTLGQVAEAIRQSSLDLPGGTIKTSGGEIVLRSKTQARARADFERIVVLTREDGTVVTVADIAGVIDGFRDDDNRAFLDGRPAVVVRVSRVGEEDIIDIASAVHAWIAEARPRMPEGIALIPYNDEAEALGKRISTLLTSASGGLVLVLVLLSLLLRFRLALWVAAGIPIALLGTVFFFPALDLSINSLAVMAFILVLGIVVDDAIIVGERVYAHEQRTDDRLQAAIQGTQEVSVPVIFGVLTTVVAFMPLILVEGRMGDFFSVLGFVVIIALMMSLVECKLILPAHLAHRRISADTDRGWNGFQRRVARGLERFSHEVYQPALDRLLTWRYLVLASGVGVLIVVLGLVASGRVVFQFFPAIEGDRVYATLTLPRGTPLPLTEAAVRQLEASAQVLARELDTERSPDEGSAVRYTLSSIGQHLDRGGPPRPNQSSGGAHLGEVSLELVPGSERAWTSGEIANRWRELTGPVPGAEELRFEAAAFHAGKPIDLRLAGDDIDLLRSAADEIRRELEGYPGVLDVGDSFRVGKRELQLEILPGARALGLRQQDLAQQVREAFYGAEVQRVQRGPEDVKVMVRYPASERRSLADLEDMRIRTADGAEVPFGSVARATTQRGYATINRTDGRRVVNVTADVDRSVTTPEQVLESLLATRLPPILERHPGVKHFLEGEQREHSRAMAGLARGLVLALLAVYGLLAIPLRSYTQPLLIMSAIPFGAVGAIIGHFLLGVPLVFFSTLGIVALAGVVVNDSLVLVDFINREHASGRSLREAVRVAGVERFRAILLTSITTFTGLLPLIFSRDPTTFFVTPIAISLAFGVLFATVITLFLVPCGFMALEDLHAWRERRRGGPEGAAGWSEAPAAPRSDLP